MRSRAGSTAHDQAPVEQHGDAMRRWRRRSSRSSDIHSTAAPRAACSNSRAAAPRRPRRRAPWSDSRRPPAAARRTSSRAMTSFCRLPPDSVAARRDGSRRTNVEGSSSVGARSASARRRERLAGRADRRRSRLSAQVEVGDHGVVDRLAPGCRRPARESARARAAARHETPSSSDVARPDRHEAGDGLGQRDLAVAGDAGDADDLAAPDRRGRCRGRGWPCRGVRPRSTAAAARAEFGGTGPATRRDGLADHRLDQRRQAIRLRPRAPSTSRPRAHHRDAVGAGARRRRACG